MVVLLVLPRSLLYQVVGCGLADVAGITWGDRGGSFLSTHLISSLGTFSW